MAVSFGAMVVVFFGAKVDVVGAVSVEEEIVATSVEVGMEVEVVVGCTDFFTEEVF